MTPGIALQDLVARGESSRSPWRSGTVTITGDTSVSVLDVASDHRRVVSGSMYCCVRGGRFDGHDFAGAAVAAGASALLVEQPIPLDVPQVVVEDVRSWIGWLAAEVHGRPSEAMRVVGITGTNGKTTCAHLLAGVMGASGSAVEVLGTLSGARTTPEADELQRTLAALRDSGVRLVAMEVSSHALALGRVDGMRFEAAIFTNFGSDHLDFHGSNEAYFEAKASLFTPERTAAAIVNADDSAVRIVAERALVSTTTFSASGLTGVWATAREHGFRWRDRDLRVGIGGRFNVENSLAAATCGEVLGMTDEQIATGLASVPAVPGRFEFVVDHSGAAVLVDYAHDADSLSRVLLAAREVSTGRVGVVFGCGGDRDRNKRPAMGRVAVERADHVVVTTDNPRGEDPAAIAAEVVAEVRPGSVTVELDRREAIDGALRWLAEGDVLVVAGKGHERHQEIEGRLVPFDDAAVIRELAGIGR